MELLTTASDSDNLLVLLLNVTDLLASCCEGKNSFIESICQTIFSMEELMKVHTSMHMSAIILVDISSYFNLLFF